MVYTVTLNPSLDYMVSVPDFLLGKTNRTAWEQLNPGGKGINVSLALKALGVPSLALGILAGFTGEEILRRLHALRLDTDFIMLPDGLSRINIKLTDTDGTEINGTGPEIKEEALDTFRNKLEDLKPGDWLVLSGSLPPSLPKDAYRRLAAHAGAKGALAVVDAAGENLARALAGRPFLVKPNLQELEDFFGCSIADKTQAIGYAQKLQAMGAENVMVSLGSQGAILVTGQGEVFSAPAPAGKVIHTIGAGDAMVAGFIAAWAAGKHAADALAMAVACGSAKAFCQGFAEKEAVLRIFNEIPIELLFSTGECHESSDIHSFC